MMLETCPTCGAQVLFTGTVCPHCQIDRAKPDPEAVAQWQRRAVLSSWRAAVPEGLDHSSGTAFMNAKPRRCTCGGIMVPAAIRQSHLTLFYTLKIMPTGYELDYRCQSCGREIEIPSLGAIVKAGLYLLMSFLLLIGAGWAWVQHREEPRDKFGMFVLGGLGLLMFFISTLTLRNGLVNPPRHPEIEWTR